MTDPPPTAKIMSGSNVVISAPHSLTLSMGASGWALFQMCVVNPAPSSTLAAFSANFSLNSSVTKKLLFVVQRVVKMSMIDGWGMNASAREFAPITRAGMLKKEARPLMDVDVASGSRDLIPGS